MVGVGVVSALAVGGRAFWDALNAGATGLRTETLADAPLQRRVYARVPQASLDGLGGDERLRRVCNRPFDLLLAAANLALADARLSPKIPSSRIGISVGMGTLDTSIEEFDAPRDDASNYATGGGASRARPHLHPFRRLRQLPNIGPSLVSMAHGFAGPTMTFVSGLTAGLQALIEGFEMIRDGRADVMICGGSDSRLTQRLLSIADAEGLVSRQTDPNIACRPFDRAQTGLVAGEGAAILVLQSDRVPYNGGRAHYGEMLGGASLSSVQGTALQDVLQTLSESLPLPDAVVAHGDGTPSSDFLESRALSDARYLRSVRAVTAIQGATGHTFSAAGAIAAATACLSLDGQRLPPIRNLSDPIAVLPFVTFNSAVWAPANVLANVLDFNGSAASALFTRLPC